MALPHLVPRCEGAFQFPRRNCVDEWTPAEKAIADAMRAVEALGGDVRLTDAICFLSEAATKVADCLEDPAFTPHVPTEKA